MMNRIEWRSPQSRFILYTGSLLLASSLAAWLIAYWAGQADAGLPATAGLMALPLLAFLGVALLLTRRFARDVTTRHRQENEDQRLLAEKETILDISKRRQAEEEAHKLLRAVEQCPISIVITDRQGCIEYVNPRFTRVTGYAIDEVIGQKASLLKSDETPTATYDALWSTITAGREWHGILRNRRKNGSLFWEEASISPIFDEKREITHFLAVKENIDERKKTEDALRSSHNAYADVLATSLDGFWMTDSEGSLLDVNQTYVRQSGYSHEELLSMRISDLDASESPSDTSRRIKSIVRQGNEQFETTHRRKDGSIWHVEVSTNYRAAAGGRFYVFLRDITARKQIHMQLEAQQENLEGLVNQRTADLAAALEAAKVADRTKDAFLANISHELRTPLNAVIGLSSLACRASVEPKQRETLNKILSAGKTLHAIINDLLDLTKITAGEMRFDTLPFQPREILARVCSAMHVQAAEKGLLLKESVGEDVPELLLGDPLRVEQILFNLIGNAIKFTNSGDVSVRLGCVSRSEERAIVEIEVCDSGIGLSDEEIDLLFKPFSQADISITRKHGGTGLGLAICKHLAIQMQGRIEVRSRPGQGSTFRVELSFGVGGNGIAEKEQGRIQTNPGAPPNIFSGAQVLLVDDQEINREIVVELLATVGVVAQEARNGREALDILFAAGPSAFDLVLMDVQMPVLDGLSATREIRARAGFASLPIIAMTAHTMEHEKASYVKAGMSDHLGKPFVMSDFFSLLGNWLPETKNRTSPPD